MNENSTLDSTRYFPENPPQSPSNTVWVVAVVVAFIAVIAVIVFVMVVSCRQSQGGLAAGGGNGDPVPAADNADAVSEVLSASPSDASTTDHDEAN